LPPHHRRNVKKALSAVQVEHCVPDSVTLAEWERLYAELVRRHDIRGIAAFTPRALKLQFDVPGLVALRALHGDETVGMSLWYLQGQVAYYHLAAYSELGYALRASYALFWTALEEFSAAGIRWAGLGGGAGVDGVEADGLSRFKRGWSTGTRPASFCATVLRPDLYQRILEERAVRPGRYFPAYRQGEFA
jgi:hypothetical protein